MDAVIIYDDRALAAKANGMLTSAVHHAGEAWQWSVKPWRLDLLMLPSAADEALQDAAQAHLIVLAVGSLDACSPSLLGWLEKWAACRQVPEAALAMLDKSASGDLLSAMTPPELSLFATRHGLSFIFGDVNPVENDGTALDPDRREPEFPVTPARLPMPGEPTATAYRSWGINE